MEQVENYLNKLMESDSFTIDDLLELTVEDLADNDELSQIGKITLSSVLAAYKSKYEDDFFDEIDSEVLAEMGVPVMPELKNNHPTSILSAEEITFVKKLLQQKGENQNSELIELKLALKNAGVDYMMILKDYRIQKEIELKEWEDSIKG